MSELDDAAVRLGLALFRKTVVSGPGFYSIYDLVFDESQKAKPGLLYLRTFSEKKDFWAVQQEAARLLDGAGLVQAHHKKIESSAVSDVSIRLTTLGKAVYSLANLQFERGAELIEDISIADLAVVLQSDDQSQELAADLRALDTKLNELQLSNFERAAVTSYVTMLTVICDMPERDTKLFWVILERLSHIAGVASLIVALIAMRLAR